MKKTLTINLGGIIFHIDEDAYQFLNQYLDSLSKHFRKQEGFEDILADIESRIAELLGEKCTETKQVITLEDVNEVIAIMGQPAEMDREDEQQKGHQKWEEKGDKRFFRNPDEKLIAGVCSGIAAYLHLDPVWVRLMFILFVAAGGSGILIYIVLWMVVPEAKSTSERLEMRGKKITIRNIERSIREGVSDIGGKIGSMASESAASIKSAGRGSGIFFETVGKGILEVLKFIGRALLILTGVILVLVGLGILIALFAFIFGWTAGLYNDADYTVLSFPSMAKLMIGCNMPVVYLQVISMVVIGIPFFMIFYNGLRMIFRFDRIRHFGLTMFNIWIVGLFFLAWAGTRVYNLYKFSDQKQFDIEMQQPASDTLHVILITDDPGMKYLRYEKYQMPGDWKAVISDDNEIYMVPKIVIEESGDSLYSISQVTMARGKSRQEAQQHLAGVRFQSATSGSTLSISPFVRLPREECWRGQIVDLIIRVPRGKFIHFDRQMKELDPFWYYRLNSSDESTFQMTERGIEVIPGHDYIKVKGNQTTTIRIN